MGFVTTPLLLAGLGVYLFGVRQILRRLIGYFSAAGARPAQAQKWTIAKQQVSTEYQKSRVSVGNAVAVWVLFLPLVAVVERFLGISLLSQLKNVLRPVAITLLLLVLALGVGRLLTVSTWISLIVSVGATTVVVSLPAFYAGLSGDQRRRILHRVRLVTAQVFVC